MGTSAASSDVLSSCDNCSACSYGGDASRLASALLFCISIALSCASSASHPAGAVLTCCARGPGMIATPCPARLINHVDVRLTCPPLLQKYSIHGRYDAQSPCACRAQLLPGLCIAPATAIVSRNGYCLPMVLLGDTL